MSAYPVISETEAKIRATMEKSRGRSPYVVRQLFVTHRQTYTVMTDVSDIRLARRLRVATVRNSRLYWPWPWPLEWMFQSLRYLRQLVFS